MGNRIQSRDLHRFDNLIRELVQGGPKRTVFQPWEMQLLLDLSTYPVKRRHRATMLLRYQAAVQRIIQRGESDFPPPSEFFLQRRQKQHPQTAAPA
jgi:hypothetical protein